MSLKSTETKLVIAGLAAAAAFGGAASAASAATLKETYSCDYPLIGAQPLTVSIDAALPTTAKVGTATPTFAVKATAVAGGDTYSGLQIVGAKTIEGKANAGSTITAPQGTLTPGVSTTVAKYTVPATAGDLTLSASGTGPAVTFTKAGTATVKVTSLKLNLIARKADGTAITSLSSAQSGPASDSDPATFDVPCTLSPTSQNTTLGTVAIS